MDEEQESGKPEPERVKVGLISLITDREDRGERKDGGFRTRVKTDQTFPSIWSELKSKVQPPESAVRTVWVRDSSSPTWASTESYSAPFFSVPCFFLFKCKGISLLEDVFLSFVYTQGTFSAVSRPGSGGVHGTDIDLPVNRT